MQQREEQIYKLRQNKELIASQVESRILKNKTIWKIQYNQRWENILRSIDRADIKIFKIIGEGSERMFKTINSINFSELIEIGLNNLNLISTQFLLSVNAPHLQYIRLNCNKLSNVKSLRKLPFLELKQLHLHDNLIFDCSPLVQLCGDKENLKIQVACTSKLPYIHARTVFMTNPIQNYNVFFKLRPNAMMIAKPAQLGCINSHIIGPMFQQKYKGLENFN